MERSSHECRAALGEEALLLTLCFTLSFPPTASAFGDPHFITFDGLNFTFKGLGEYLVLGSKRTSLSVQGRTRRAQLLNGQPGAVLLFAFWPPPLPTFWRIHGCIKLSPALDSAKEHQQGHLQHWGGWIPWRPLAHPPQHDLPGGPNHSPSTYGTSFGQRGFSSRPRASLASDRRHVEGLRSARQRPADLRARREKGKGETQDKCEVLNPQSLFIPTQIYLSDP